MNKASTTFEELDQNKLKKSILNIIDALSPNNAKITNGETLIDEWYNFNHTMNNIICNGINNGKWCCLCCGKKDNLAQSAGCVKCYSIRVK